MLKIYISWQVAGFPIGLPGGHPGIWNRKAFPMEKMREVPRVSAAQYALFRHHLKRPSRSCQRGKSEQQGHLLDLGEEEKTDKVSWMDQPSLLDTMASAARIAQGLKNYEEVDKTPGIRGPSDLPTAAEERCSTEEFRLPATSPQSGAYSPVWGITCRWTRTKGTTTTWA